MARTGVCWVLFGGGCWVFFCGESFWLVGFGFFCGFFWGGSVCLGYCDVFGTRLLCTMKGSNSNVPCRRPENRNHITTKTRGAKARESHGPRLMIGWKGSFIDAAGGENLTLLM